jgi:hypothetical protein
MALRSLPRVAFLWVAAVVVATSVAVASGTVSISALLATPSTYDGAHVVVTGTVSNVNPKTSRAGNEYETFSLCDANSNCVKVFTWGQPALNDGDRKTVRGVFSAVKHVGGYNFYNEIESDEGSL